ncbi:MAG TPA: DUF1501 domain-containing protein [Gammaproteobacteria bacterium]|nr:DUF1501 domain-containing protein [Gammaproteobacteria bacterium]
MVTRRSLLAASAQCAALAAAAPRLVLADHPGDARLVFVILRGALDGLAAVPPYGEPRYAALRGELALASPTSTGGALKLDGMFALHPSFKNLHALYGSRELAVLHAVATPYRERSHFDGQAVLENGGTAAPALHDGWLNRSLGGLGNAREAAIAVADNVPLVLRGDRPVTSWAPSRLPDAPDDTLERIMDLYANDALLGARLRDALATKEMAGDAGGGARGDGQLGALVSATAKFLAAPDGPRIAVLEATGWDTHANQGAEQGQLAARLGGLDAGIGALKRDLGDAWKHTAVLVVTEFGRTVAVNGTRGTDHGTGTCAFLAGGAVKGGRVIADWPGLTERDLYQARDLKPTTDLRAVFKGVLRDHLGVAAVTLDEQVFPGSAAVRARDGLIRSA